MEFRIKGCIGALMMGCVFAACEDDTDKGGPDVDQPKEATYLLYMVGQNDLKQYLNANISDMKIGYGKSDINGQRVGVCRYQFGADIISDWER